MNLTQNAPPWRQIQRTNFVQWEVLADFLELDVAQRTVILKHSHFPLNIPLRLAKKMQKGSLNDPLLMQFLPHIDELNKTKGFEVDPVGDQMARKSKKLIHKYQNRVLLVCTSACAMHCRFCFRQNFAYTTNDPSFEEELKIISADSSIHEVILSGGDPLSLSDQSLGLLLHAFNKMTHVKRVRFHTRFPIAIPERIDDSFIALMASMHKQIWFILHINHPSEVDDTLLFKIKQLQRLGIIVMSQTVLLRGVNDNVDTLRALYEMLVDHGIIPYYLHQLDRVQGTAHFEVPEIQGKQLIEELTKLLPGYAIPRYVREEIGAESKTLL